MHCACRSGQEPVIVMQRSAREDTVDTVILPVQFTRDYDANILFNLAGLHAHLREI